jgi:hypothetical protein
MALGAECIHTMQALCMQGRKSALCLGKVRGSAGCSCCAWRGPRHSSQRQACQPVITSKDGHVMA